MAEIKLSRLRFVPIITQIYKEYELSSQQAHIYGYIFNHCMNINKDGYCGYSDEFMATDLKIGYERFRKELAVLKNKGLIVIQNPGKRTKQTGLSRMIRINSDVFLDEQQVSLQEIVNDNLKKENERLKKQIADLLAEKEPDPVPNGWLQFLIDAGVIPEQDIPRACKVLNTMYEAFAQEFHFTEMKKHLSYMINQLAEKKVTDDITMPAHQQVHTDVVQYLRTSCDDYFRYLHGTRNW